MRDDLAEKDASSSNPPPPRNVMTNYDLEDAHLEEGREGSGGSSKGG